MAPPLPTITIDELSSKVNTLPNGKRRKPPVTLSSCALKEIVQYKCNLADPKQRKGQPLVICKPVVRLFRQCADGLTVETTAWEGWNAGQQADSKNA